MFAQKKWRNAVEFEIARNDKEENYGGEMSASFGKITAHPAEPIEKVSDELVALINKKIKPPQPVASADV